MDREQETAKSPPPVEITPEMQADFDELFRLCAPPLRRLIAKQEAAKAEAQTALAGAHEKAAI